MSKEPIPKTYAIDVCKMGQNHDCCRYLACGAEGFECLKHGDLASVVDARAANGTMHARSDNCAGWEKI